MNLEGLVAGSVVVVALAAFKLVEKVVWKRPDTGSFSSLDREKLNNVAKIVSRCDSEGVPMAYAPRRLVKLAETQTELMRTMLALVQQQTALSKALHEHLKAHQDREEDELRQIRTALEKFVA